MNLNNEKYNNLKEYLKELQRVVIAFSGGVDSTFIIKTAKDVLGENALAVTIDSPYIPRWEIKEAEKIAKEIGINHLIINVPKIMDSIRFNPKDRCYLCKTFLFNEINTIANSEGFSYVLDGTNADDIKDYRPGLVALKELKIKSPLLELGITKEEVRSFSKDLELSTWDKPSYACLLSRIPYNQEIISEDLEIIEKAEKFIMDLGYKAIRVRKHGDLARIEVDSLDKTNFINDENIVEVSKRLKEMGFNYVTLDLEGYRTGSLNEVLDKKAAK